jgi:hypothetical protein
MNINIKEIILALVIYIPTYLIVKSLFGFDVAVFIAIIPSIILTVIIQKIIFKKENNNN